MTDILWEDKLTRFLGRNGMFRCSGVAVCGEVDVVNEPGVQQAIVVLEPLTGQGNIGRARLEIPVNKIDKVIEGLKEAKDQALADLHKVRKA